MSNFFIVTMINQEKFIVAVNEQYKSRPVYEELIDKIQHIMQKSTVLDDMYSISPDGELTLPTFTNLEALATYLKPLNLRLTWNTEWFSSSSISEMWEDEKKIGLFDVGAIRDISSPEFYTEFIDIWLSETGRLLFNSVDYNLEYPLIAGEDVGRFIAEFDDAVNRCLNQDMTGFNQKYLRFHEPIWNDLKKSSEQFHEGFDAGFSDAITFSHL